MSNPSVTNKYNKPSLAGRDSIRLLVCHTSLSLTISVTSIIIETRRCRIFTIHIHSFRWGLTKQENPATSQTSKKVNNLKMIQTTKRAIFVAIFINRKELNLKRPCISIQERLSANSRLGSDLWNNRFQLNRWALKSLECKLFVSTVRGGSDRARCIRTVGFVQTATKFTNQ